MSIAVVAAVGSALLSGCGGAEGDATVTASRQLAAALAAAVAARDVQPAAARPERRALAADEIRSAEIFDWAEFTFPGFFPKPRREQWVEHAGTTYLVAVYDNGNLLGLTGSREVWGLGPYTSGVVTRHGALDDFVERIRADRLRVYPPSPAPAPSPSPAPAPGPAPDLSRYALQPTSRPAQYPIDPEGLVRAAALDYLNAVRLAAGAGALTQVASIDAAAQAHSEYLRLNATHPSTRGLNAHNEMPGLPGFTGGKPLDRMKAQGYPGTGGAEIIGAGIVRRPTHCMQFLLGTVYHMGAALASDRDVGVGVSTGGAASASCVVNFGSRNGSPQYPAAGTVVTYPYDGQSGVRFAFSNLNEVPIPFQSVNWTVGPPIMASMFNLSAFVGTNPTDLSVSEFVLKDSRGHVVPSFVIGHSSVKFDAGLQRVDDSANDRFYRPPQVFLIPSAPLEFDTVYHVSFRGSHRGIPHAKAWSFRSQPSPFQLQAGPVLPAYPATEAGRRAAELLTQLNVVRSQAGAGLLTQDVETDGRLQAFVDCTAANGGSVIGCTRTGLSYTGTDTPQLLESLLSRHDQLARFLSNSRQFAAAVSKRPASALWDYHVAITNYDGERQDPEPGGVVIYPYPGQKNVGRQASPLNTIPAGAGQPIMARMTFMSAFKCRAPSDSIEVDAFVLRNAAGTVVPTHLLAHPNDKVMQPGDRLDSRGSQGSFFLLAKTPLNPNASYTVEFRGRYCGVPHDKTWSFTTRG